MPKRKQTPIPDLRGQWENYALTHGLPMRCETNIVYWDGSCIVCSAANGEACRRATPPTHPPRDSDGSPEGEDALAASSQTTARAEGIAPDQSPIIPPRSMK